jgi:hypothetical protein
MDFRTPVAQHRDRKREPLPEPAHRNRGVELLEKAERRTAEHDENDDRRIEDLMHGEGNQGAEDQNKHEGAFELPQQKAKGVGAAVLLDGIRAVALQPPQGLGLRKPRGSGPEHRHQLGGLDGPVRLALARVRGRLLHRL